MKQTLAGLTLGLAVIAGANAPAAAADWNNGPGSIKHMGGSAAVPVPAPVPIPVYNANWYFRFDAGIGIGSGGPDFSEDGMQYGHMDSPGATGPEPFGMSSSWFNDDYPTFATYGAGVGYIWSPRLRTDITVEGRTRGRNVIEGETSYIQHAYDCCGVWGPIVDGVTGNPTTQVNVQTTDSTRIQGGMAMLNVYYDFDKMRGFTPYVGAGIGFSFNELSRSHTTTETTCDLTTTPPCSANFFRSTYSASDRQHTMSLAAMLTAGFSYQVSDITALDFNYRFLHLEGTSANLAITNGDPTPRTMTSRVSIGDTQEHQLRAGLRFNIH